MVNNILVYSSVVGFGSLMAMGIYAQYKYIKISNWYDRNFCEIEEKLSKHNIVIEHDLTHWRFCFMLGGYLVKTKWIEPTRGKVLIYRMFTNGEHPVVVLGQMIEPVQTKII